LILDLVDVRDVWAVLYPTWQCPALTLERREQMYHWYNGLSFALSIAECCAALHVVTYGDPED
jgi:hypothetical protein